jgi:hypothetical protein
MVGEDDFVDAGPAARAWRPPEYWANHYREALRRIADATPDIRNFELRRWAQEALRGGD